MLCCDILHNIIRETSITFELIIQLYISFHHVQIFLIKVNRYAYEQYPAWKPSVENKFAQI